MSQNPNAADLDFIVINLGANDSFSETSVQNLETMVTSIRAYSSTVRILLMTEYVSPREGYCLTQSTNLNVSAMRARQTRYFAYMSEQFEGREDEGIYLVSTHLSINSWSDWTRADSATLDGTLERITDVIHLGYAGYQKESAAIRAYLYWIFGT